MVIHTDDSFCLLALVLHGTALVIWIRLQHHLEKWVFWVVSTWMVIIMLRQILLVFDCISAAKYTTSVLSAMTLLSVIWASRTFNKYKKIEDENTSLAAGLAGMAQKYKAKIEFYENQARQHGLSTLPPTQRIGKTSVDGRISLVKKKLSGWYRQVQPRDTHCEISPF